MMERTVLFYDFHRQYRMPRSQNVLRLGQNRSLGPTGPCWSVVALVTLAIDRLLPTDGLSATPKAAVWQMVKQLAGEEGVNNIRVNAVGPGVVDGGMLTPMLEDPDVRAVVDQAMEVTPLRRKAKYEDIGHAVLYLASSRSGFVTGQHFHVDGGLSL